MHLLKLNKKHKKTVKKVLGSRMFSSKVLTFIGLILVFTSLGYKAHQSNALSFNKVPEAAQLGYANSDIPASLVIPKRNVSVSIKPATITNGNWASSQETASYLVQSSVPGKEGNIVVYAHNKKELFGNLQNADFGDIIHLRTNDGSIQKYEVRKKFIVSPNDIDSVQPTSYEVLTLFTCTGFADMKRLIIQAYPLS